MVDVKITCKGEEDVWKALHSGVAVCKALSVVSITVQFDRDITVTCTPESSVADLQEIYQLKVRLRNKVGPS